MSETIPKQAFRPDIQGLRAIAVLSVLAYHVGVPLFGGGYLGVDVFFVISGYLIGGQLVRELRATGQLNFPEFYARRARRILPASLTVIVLTVLASLVFAPPLRAPEIVLDALWASLSAANLRFAVQGTDYLAGTAPSPLQHYWSLGVEEQFYLVVPIVLVGLFVALRSRPRLLVATGASVIGASFVVCLLWGAASPWTYFALPARAWELGLGVLVAAAAPLTRTLAQPWRHGVAGIGAVTLIWSGWLGGRPGFEHPGVGTLLPVLATAAIILAGEVGVRPVPLVNRGLGIRPAQFIGTLSFSLYLVHWPVLALARENATQGNASEGDAVPLGTMILVAAISLPLAWLLWRCVERPFLRRKNPDTGARRPLLIAGICTAALVVSLTAAVPALAMRPLTSSQPAASGITRLPAGTAIVPSNVHPLLRDVAADTGELYSNGCQQTTTAAELSVCAFGESSGSTVVLFGDSHAGRWFPALRAAFAGRPIRLVTLTKSGCRSLETARLWSAAENQSCVSWRASALQWIQDNPPDLVVIANHLGFSDSPDKVSVSRWRDATQSTVARFPNGVPVAIIAETPEFDFSPPVCLSRHLDDAPVCSGLRTTVVNSSAIAGVRLGAAPAGAAFVDLTDWFCNAHRCPTVIGSTLVYTDEHHLSATFSAELGPAVYDALSPLIAKR